MRKWRNVYLLTIGLLPGVAAIAQSNAASTANTSELMASGGKIYVVMAVVITILAGLIFYVARLDGKISKLEKEG